MVQGNTNKYDNVKYFSCCVQNSSECKIEGRFSQWDLVIELDPGTKGVNQVMTLIILRKISLIDRNNDLRRQCMNFQVQNIPSWCSLWVFFVLLFCNNVTSVDVCNGGNNKVVCHQSVIFSLDQYLKPCTKVLSLKACVRNGK